MSELKFILNVMEDVNAALPATAPHRITLGKAIEKATRLLSAPGPTVQQAQEMGEHGAPHNDHERQLYEAYCKGHCWAVGPWSEELGCYMELDDRIRFAMWRDRGALGNASIFQSRVEPWMKVCFGDKIMADVVERNQRFFEEATELVQANGMSQEDCHKLVDYVYGRPIGELQQEVGGVMVTLAALCLASGVNMHEAGDTELARVWTKIEQIRAKQVAKPKDSPLPQAVTEVSTDEFLQTREDAFDEWEADESFAKYSHNPRSTFYAGWKYRGRQLAGVQVMDARPSLELLIGAVDAVHSDMLAQCRSNPIKNAWGQEVNVRKINEAKLLAGKLKDVFRVPDGVLLEAIREEIGPELFDMQSPDTWLRVAGALRKAGGGVIFEKEGASS